jgi:hypothetical protein
MSSPIFISKESLLDGILSVKTQIILNESTGVIEISFVDGSGAILKGSGLEGTISDVETIRGKRGNFARVWLDFYFWDVSPSDTDSFMNLLNNIVYPFIEKTYEH